MFSQWTLKHTSANLIQLVQFQLDVFVSIDLFLPSVNSDTETLRYVAFNRHALQVGAEQSQRSAFATNEALVAAGFFVEEYDEFLRFLHRQRARRLSQER